MSRFCSENFVRQGKFLKEYWRISRKFDDGWRNSRQKMGIHDFLSKAPREYEQKKALLYANGIAVWDVIAKCEVDGALDSAIRNPVYNSDLPEFISDNGISRVYFNGNNAYIFYKRGIGKIDKNVLPSTSPAYAGMGIDRKVQLWRDALKD